jgi:hypothetical protein
MRSAWTTGADFLRQRMSNPAQLLAPVPEAEMPPYMESFLAHLRLLIGVPFDYLVADARLLPDESIRFFHIDRSWTDRLVDGAISVGKIGSREQAHHQAQSPGVQQQLDLSERIVRILQRGLKDFPTAKTLNDANQQSGEIITGFLLRSAAVSGWPHMDVRAYTEVLPQGYNPSSIPSDGTPGATGGMQLKTLRLERLSPSVLVALFQGIPKLVVCEEPHHGIQFGVQEQRNRLFIDVRDASGHLLPDSVGGKAITVPEKQLTLPMRASGRRVIAVAQLRKDVIARDQQLQANHPGIPPLPAQTGAAGFAISVLDPPWRQRFQGQGGDPETTGTGRFIPAVPIAVTVERPELQVAVKGLVK